MNDNGEERTDLVVLVDEDGNEHDFAMIDRFQVDFKDYAILVPVLYLEDDLEGDEIGYENEAYIFRVDMEEGQETLVEVEDETEWDEVASLWEDRMQSIEPEDNDDSDNGY